MYPFHLTFLPNAQTAEPEPPEPHPLGWTDPESGAGRPGNEVVLGGRTVNCSVLAELVVWADTSESHHHPDPP